MNFPAIATRTFQRLCKVPKFFKISSNISKVIASLSSPYKKARFSHNKIDSFINELFQQDIVKDYVSCHEGCSACCHTQVSVTEFEADLLAKRVKEGVKVDFDRLERQARAFNSGKLWYQIPYEERKCVFLDQDKRCSVYEDRPMVCRTNYAIGNPDQCSTKNGIEKPIRLLNTEKADFVIIGAFSESRENGTLPYMLLKSLGRALKSKNKVQQDLAVLSSKSISNEILK